MRDEHGGQRHAAPSQVRRIRPVVWVQVFLTLKRAADCHALGVGSVIALTLGAGATALLQTTVLVHAISVAAVPWGGSVAAALALPMASLVLCSACYCTGLLHRVSRSRKRTA